MPRVRAVAPLVLSAVLLLGVVAPAGAAGTNDPAGYHKPKVGIWDYYFKPATKTITLGQYVVWRNYGATVHNATSDTGVFSTGNLAPGEKARFKFKKAGTYPYTCTIHGFHGTIIVNP
jgi:plastocyanin